VEYRCLLGLKVQFSKTRPGRAPGAPTAHPAPSPETAGRAAPSTAPSRPVLVGLHVDLDPLGRRPGTAASGRACAGTRGTGATTPGPLNSLLMSL
jgi:hypothetical protein